jgi:hypothetical protein
MAWKQSKEQMLLQLRQNPVRAYKRRRMGPSPAFATKSDDQDLTKADMEVEETPGYYFFLTYRRSSPCMSVNKCIVYVPLFFKDLVP